MLVCSSYIAEAFKRVSRDKREESRLTLDWLGLGVSCKSGTFSFITYYIPIYHIMVTGHPYHIRTPR